MQKYDKVIYLLDKDIIVYYIEKIGNELFEIIGVYQRIKRTVKEDEIRLATIKEIEDEERQASFYYMNITNTSIREKRKYILGKVLHIDGDKNYLDKCLKLYEGVGVVAYGLCFEEKDIVNIIDEYIDKLNPDIVVITGHDLYNQKGIKDLDNYANTKHFIEAIRKIRLRKSNYSCCVIAGACQSNFEALIANGADFASSPKRINVHTFDPAVIAIKVATTSFSRIVDLNSAFKYIENGRNAFGGVETFGKMKLML